MELLMMGMVPWRFCSSSMIVWLGVILVGTDCQLLRLSLVELVHRISSFFYNSRCVGEARRVTTAGHSYILRLCAIV